MKPFSPPATSNIDLDATREERWDFERLEAAVIEAGGRLDAPTAAIIGPLSIETRTHQDHHDRWHQIRSRPLSGFGGAEFRYDVPRGRVLPANPIVEGVLAAANGFVRNRDTICARAEAARSTATNALQGLAGTSYAPALEGVGVGIDPGDDHPTIVLEVRTLGHGLFPITERLQAGSDEALSGKLEALLERHARRDRLRERLDAEGIGGWVDETTRRILATVGKDPAWAMDRLRECGTIDLWFPLDPGSIHARVRWREGVLRTEHSNPGLLLHVEEDIVTVFRLLPAKTLAARIGRPIGRLIKDQFVPPEAILTDATRHDNGWTTLALAIPKTPLPIRPPFNQADR